jgi:hypothetical protein
MSGSSARQAVWTATMQLYEKEPAVKGGTIRDGLADQGPWG